MSYFWAPEGAEDLKGHIQKFKEDMSNTIKVSTDDIQAIHILVEQATHDLRNHRPQVIITSTTTGNNAVVLQSNLLRKKVKPLWQIARHHEGVKQTLPRIHVYERENCLRMKCYICCGA